MPDPAPDTRLVLTTTANAEEAEKLARLLVEEGLAACATLIPGVQSVYRWKGAIESSTESMVMIKTEVQKLAAVETRLHEIHSYEIPEFLVLAVESGSRRYLDWIRDSVRE